MDNLRSNNFFIILISALPHQKFISEIGKTHTNISVVVEPLGSQQKWIVNLKILMGEITHRKKKEKLQKKDVYSCHSISPSATQTICNGHQILMILKQQDSPNKKG